MTTGWIFDISLCENSINQSKQYNNSGTFFHIALSPSPQLFDQTTFHTFFRCLFFFFLFFISLNNIADGPHSILPVVTKDLSISPRFTPYDLAMQVHHSYNSSTNGRILLTRVLTLSATEEKKQILVTRIELPTSALEGSQLAASLEGEPGPTPARKTLPHSYPQTRFRGERARDEYRYTINYREIMEESGASCAQPRTG